MNGIHHGMSLTPRENELVHCLVQGMSNKNIADSLGISANTVKDHFYSIFIKEGIHSRTELALKYSFLLNVGAGI